MTDMGIGEGVLESRRVGNGRNRTIWAKRTDLKEALDAI